ncbi:MAG TPA: sensor domain-containing protein [Streptosporangiaceae bacterium]
MATTGSVNPVSAPGPSRRHGAAALSRDLLRAPVTGRARRDLLFCLAESALAVVVLAGLGALPGLPLAVTLLVSGGQPVPPPSHAHPAGVVPVFALTVIGALLLLVLLAPRAGRGLAAVHGRLAARLLGVRLAGLPPVPAARGPFGWLAATARDGPGWRAVACLVLKLPVAVAEGCAVFLAIFGPVNMTYPFWWRLFRNHPPGVHLQPAVALTPFGSLPVATFAGSFAAFAAGAAMLLAAPWLARAAAAADCWLMRAMLGPGRLTQRVADLEQTRAQAVQDSAALLRRLERDLHDGAQVRLATLAMNLGLAREKLGPGADPAVRELVDAAHRGAKDALAELRGLARGIHPPVLDNGLPDALATLAAGSPLPVRLTTALPRRPAPAIETIAYFCAAELLANATKHSRANQVTIDVAASGEVLELRVGDDGCGGADPSGGGLSGLAQRVSVVDGQVRTVSPPGGPTQITVTLPMQA